MKDMHFIVIGTKKYTVDGYFAQKDFIAIWSLSKVFFKQWHIF
jgi:hypothetical protein